MEEAAITGTVWPFVTIEMRTEPTNMINESQALSQRLSNGGMPVSEVICHAMHLGSALQSIHDEGRVYGVLTPDRVILTSSGVRLLPSEQATTVAITPYTAPEQVQGQACDLRADIFGFGAMLYEMFTGRRPFQGDTAEELAKSIVDEVPAPIGQARLDRVISTCMFKNPAARWQNMQQVMRELGSSLPLDDAGRFALRQARSRPRLRKKEQLERRWAARLEPQENAAAGPQRGINEGLSSRQAISLKEISEEIITLRAQMAETHERAVRAEQISEVARHGIAEVQAPAVKMRELQKKMEAQSFALESVRAGMEKTDALVEQVVDALGSLQSLVMDAIASIQQEPEPARYAPTPSRAVLAHQQRHIRIR